MKSTLKKLLPFAVVGVMSGATTVGALQYFNHDSNNGDQSYFTKSASNVSFAGMNSAAVGEDFVKAAKTTVPAVVTIKNYQSRSTSRASEQDLFDFFFGPQNGRGQQRQQQQAPDNMPSGMGSGVIISPDGYIISNNHVVAGANKLEVVLSNKKSYIATLVGTDPNTDISLLKIEEKGLPYLNFANSDNIDVGQWVLAVGNPLGLNSTVTAGIVSAKGRGIGILSSQGKAANPIESFIQTDAAINPGNSGGALVNTNGDLIGINSAIQSTTGYYQGYGFAVPSNLARKIVEDIKKFGIVQRGFLGVTTIDLSNDQLVAAYNKDQKTNIKAGSGMYVTGFGENSGAEDAGIKKGDIITKIDSYAITDFA
ncbi:MAG: protease, partial [Chryseobacterium sp.]